MDDGKIYITISDKRTSGGNGGGGFNDPDQTPENPIEEESDLQKYARHRFFSFVQSEAKQMVNYAISNIGNFTGDYNIQRTTQAVQRVGNIAMNVGVGFAVGGVVGGVIAIASTLINTGLEYIQGSVQTDKRNYEIDKLKELSGLNALTNGSR